ncbi:MAG: class II fructose-bisphosphate aldolase, partial [Candidatus Omnitrophica bacterium]|nr:class II fructose-bisphosphate aldolase [Candidatus Omnitrophota bacterium]
KIKDDRIVKSSVIDELAYTAALGEAGEKQKAIFLIMTAARKLGIYPASIQGLYEAIGNDEVSGFTVPAFNIRTLTYDTARTIFNIAQKLDCAAFIFEIARSEMSYTEQSPDEYSAVILAAAIKEGWRGPVFIQGDHVQVSPTRYKENPAKEIENIKSLIKAEIMAGFYNIDIDCSTMVDLNAENLMEQQRINSRLTATFLKFIRSIQPSGITISVGGEIGEVGGKNSTPEEFEAFMEGIISETEGQFPYPLISKISVQTGTSHGGIPLPDGKIAEVKLDFSVLKNIGKVAKRKYRLSGTVQHGASTLPEEFFDLFPQNYTSEVHLATGFQNIFYDHPSLPLELKNEMIDYVKLQHISEKKHGETDAQFFYRMRKHALGPFKKKILGLDSGIKSEIMDSMRKKFEIIFNKLNVLGTRQIVQSTIPETSVDVFPDRNLLKGYGFISEKEYVGE